MSVVLDNGRLIYYIKNINKLKGCNDMAKYVCSVCGYIFDEEYGCPEMDIAPGTKWEDIDDDDFQCPACGAAKAMFDKMDD
jgi:rubredoxin